MRVPVITRVRAFTFMQIILLSNISALGNDQVHHDNEVVRQEVDLTSRDGDHVAISVPKSIAVFTHAEKSETIVGVSLVFFLPELSIEPKDLCNLDLRLLRGTENHSRFYNGDADLRRQQNDWLMSHFRVGVYVNRHAGDIPRPRKR